MKYSGLNLQLVLAVLGVKKHTGGDKLYSLGHICKYKDAIVWGSKRVGEGLSSGFLLEMDIFLNSWSKQCKRSEIMQHGTEEDKANLPPATKGNQQRARKKKATRTIDHQLLIICTYACVMLMICTCACVIMFSNSSYIS